MTKVPRRTIPELVFLHQIEDSVKDIFVEGDYDAAIVLQFLRDIGYENVVVRSISCIEIDGASLRGDGRDVGNRERVIFLAKQILEHLDVEGKILCIADRDYGDWIGDLPYLRDLVFTDYSCMDSYVWDKNVLRKFLTVYCNRPDWSADQFMYALRTPLQCMFATRLAARSLGMRLEWIDRVVCIEMDGWSIVLDLREFLTRLLNKVAALDELDRLVVCVDQFRSQFSNDPRKCIHSHDFSRLAAYVLKKKGVKAVAIDEGTITRAMAACLTVADLRCESLFQRVTEFGSVGA